MLKKIGTLAILGFAVANLTGCWNLPVEPFPPTDPPVDPPPPCDTNWRDPGDTVWIEDPGFPPDDSTWVWDDSLHFDDNGGIRGGRR
jgi:hypothetical protein